MQANVDSVRYQVIRLMRMLIQLCRTLDQVPEEVTLSAVTFKPYSWLLNISISAKCPNKRRQRYAAYCAVHVGNKMHLLTYMMWGLPVIISLMSRPSACF